MKSKKKVSGVFYGNLFEGDHGFFDLFKGGRGPFAKKFGKPWFTKLCVQVI